MDSCVMSEVTRLRRRACRCEEVRFRCRYFTAPPAICEMRWGGRHGAMDGEEGMVQWIAAWERVGFLGFDDI